jgi:hypothetical protein
MRTMAGFTKGQRVRIVAGTYQKFGFGTFIGTYGKVMCSVMVDGDTRQQRNIWLSSIRPLSAKESTVEEEFTDERKSFPKHAKKNDKDNGATTGYDKATMMVVLEELLMEIDDLKRTTRHLEEKVKQIYLDHY